MPKYNGKTITARGDMVSLADMWRVVDGREGQRPAIWRRLPGTIRAVNTVANQENVPPHALFTSSPSAKTGGTFAHRRVAELYAEYLGYPWGESTVGVALEPEDLFLPNGLPSVLRGAELDFITIGETTYAKVSQVSRFMGVTPNSQAEKINKNRERWGVVNRPVRYESNGKSWEVVHILIPIDSVGELISSFNIKHVAPEHRVCVIGLKEVYRVDSMVEGSCRLQHILENSKVYVFEKGDVVKIGIATDTAKRKRKLEMSGCIDITRVYETPPTPLAKQIEHNCHRLLAQYRVKGEWFRGSFEKTTAIVEKVYNRHHSL
jgi:hypothetical protein